MEKVDCEFKSVYGRKKLSEIGYWFRKEKGLEIERDRESYFLKDEIPEIDESLNYSEEVKEAIEDLDNIQSIETYTVDSFDMSNYLRRTLPEGHPQEYELTVIDNYTTAHLIGDKALTNPAKDVIKEELGRTRRETNDPVTWLQDYVDEHIDNIDDFLSDFGL